MNDWLRARNILAIRPDNIGDVIMLGPALRAIKETSPGARITLLAARVARPLHRCCPGSTTSSPGAPSGRIWGIWRSTRRASGS
jgi:ADP-heptose:LPS heptosyltransferase